VTLNSQINWELGQYNGISVPPYALETAYQQIKHFVYIYHGCLKWPEVDISLDHDMTSFPHSQVTQNFQIWGQLGGCNGIRVPIYALET
jgi:hypothetical protein